MKIRYDDRLSIKKMAVNGLFLVVSLSNAGFKSVVKSDRMGYGRWPPGGVTW
ncbi:hypothetical protein XBFFL1_1920026 [Xenorhabdus bovienii str. feltiae Florida]|nr:hypothetical protein XBFFR1_1290001 [Xenorhabdus bovienii str. feltiae France]CDG92034.1 hypothetical protein XBFFL1_1920026 [Xenorhabdus bovienii str. feltiae Florida]